MKNKLYLFLLSTVGFLYLSSCNGLEYSPNQAFNADSPKELNKKNLALLQEASKDDTIRFILCGDTQREYSNTDKMVNAINEIHGVDFVFIAGDISDFGLLLEMDLIAQKLNRLKSPYIGVIGNHDMRANGEKIYKTMFGETDFSFVYQGVKFVCHNTCSREVDFDGSLPDLPWLKAQMQPQDGVNAYIAVAHVPPQDGDFDASLSEEYINIVNGSPNTLAGLYAHTHRQYLYFPHDQNIPYIITDATEHRSFILLEIVNGVLNYKTIYY